MGPLQATIEKPGVPRAKRRACGSSEVGGNPLHAGYRFEGGRLKQSAPSPTIALLSNDYKILQNAVLEGQPAPSGARFRESIHDLAEHPRSAAGVLNHANQKPTSLMTDVKPWAGTAPVISAGVPAAMAEVPYTAGLKFRQRARGAPPRASLAGFQQQHPARCPARFQPFVRLLLLLRRNHCLTRIAAFADPGSGNELGAAAAALLRHSFLERKDSRFLRQEVGIVEIAMSHVRSLVKLKVKQTAPA